MSDLSKFSVAQILEELLRRVRLVEERRATPVPPAVAPVVRAVPRPVPAPPRPLPSPAPAPAPAHGRKRMANASEIAQKCIEGRGTCTTEDVMAALYAAGWSTTYHAPKIMVRNLLARMRIEGKIRRSAVDTWFPKAAATQKASVSPPSAPPPAPPSEPSSESMPAAAEDYDAPTIDDPDSVLEAMDSKK